jgi:hypothetical protein
MLRNNVSLKMGPVGCPETSLQNYHPMLRKITTERKFDIIHTIVLMHYISFILSVKTQQFVV